MENTWKKIEGFNHYHINRMGEVYSEKINRLLSPYLKNGYTYITLQTSDKKKKNFRLHRLVAKTFIDNRDNPHNLNHPTFGCSIAANIVQHVSDKQQFVNPDIMSVPDAKKAVQAAQRAQERPPEQEVNSVTRGITNAIQE